MAEIVVLRQGSPTVVLNNKTTPTILHTTEVEQVVLSRDGATFETQVINAPVTNVTEVTQVIQPDDPGDLTLLFDNKLI